jgi:hypothetical protein
MRQSRQLGGPLAGGALDLYVASQDARPAILAHPRMKCDANVHAALSCGSGPS